MEEFYLWIIIILLIAIIAKLNQGDKRLSAKELEKRKKEMWKVTWWIVGICLFIFLLLILMIWWKPILRFIFLEN